MDPCLCCLLPPADVGTDWIEGQPVSGVQYKTADGTLRTASAHLTVVCDGMYSTFRKQLAEGAIKHPSFFVGLLLKGVTLPYPNHGHVVLAKPSPVLFYPISDTEVGRVLWQQGLLARCVCPLHVQTLVVSFLHVPVGCHLLGATPPPVPTGFVARHTAGICCHPSMMHVCVLQLIMLTLVTCPARVSPTGAVPGGRPRGEAAC